MRIAVTGGAGFIGSHVVDALLARGDEVLAVDNFDPYYPAVLKWANLREARRVPSFELDTTDLRDGAALKALFERWRPDAVVHLAARAGVRPSVEHPALYMDVNVTGTVHVFEAARLAGAHRVVFASSSSVYGRRTDVPFCEDDATDAPASPYAASKRAGEVLGRTWHELHGVDVVCLRFFTVYGPRQRPEMAFSRFMRAVYEGRPLPVYGDGSMARDYTYVGDVARAVLSAVDWSGRWGVFNVGGGHCATLLDVIAVLRGVTGRDIAVEHLPAPPADVPMTAASLDRVGAELGWQPRVPLDEGMGRMWEWFVRQATRA